jgi:hypothetical protein
MATTTNYSWTTPDDTALVKDGAAAIRSLGTAIDSTVFTNAGAAVAKATVDAKGDLIAGTADNTIARLAVGANDTVLTADSSTATGLKWAAPASGGGMTVIASGSLSSTSTSITSIAGTYNDLELRILNYEPSPSGGNMQIRFNNDSGASKYAANTSSTDSRARNFSQTNSAIAYDPNDTTNTGLITLRIPNYANATTAKMGFFYSMVNNGASPTTINTALGIMAYKEVDAITSIQMVFDGSSATAGTYILYGVK